MVFFKSTQNATNANQEPTTPVVEEWKYDAKNDMFYTGKSHDEIATEGRLKIIADKKDGPRNK